MCKFEQMHGKRLNQREISKQRVGRGKKTSWGCKEGARMIRVEKVEGNIVAGKNNVLKVREYEVGNSSNEVTESVPKT